MLKIDLSLTRPDNRVEYELWYSSILDMSKDQLVDLGKYQKPFGNQTLFTPRILTFACPTCPKVVQEKNCYSSGRYCPFQPKYRIYDDSEEGGLTNSYEDRDYRLAEISKSVSDLTLLWESLREKCLYNKVAKTDDS